MFTGWRRDSSPAFAGRTKLTIIPSFTEHTAKVMTTELAPDRRRLSLPEGTAADGPTCLESRKIALARPRNEAIDVVRLIAAIGIVYVHAVRSPALDSSRNLFRFPVPFYLFASFYYQSLSLRRKTERTLRQYIAGCIKRLYLPFLGWSVIYFIARNIRRKFVLHVALARLEPGLLWKGVEYHLWFLPFLLAGSILLALIHWTILRHTRRWRWPLIGLAIACGFVFAYSQMPASWDQTFDSPTYAYVQVWRAMPALCWALAFSWIMTMGPVVYPVSLAAGFAGIALTVFCSVKQALHGIQLVPRALSGFGCMVAALAPWNRRWMPVLARFGRYSYGIYLSHVLIAEIFRNIAIRAQLPDTAALDIVMFLSTLAGSFMLVLALASSRRTAWLNG